MPTDLVTGVLGAEGESRVYAPTGIAAFHVGASAGRRLLQLPTGRKVFGKLDPLKGEGLRNLQGDLNRCALLVGDERGMIGRARLGWEGYHASIAPIRRQSASSTSRGGRQVVNLLGDDSQIPPVLDAPCYERSSRGPAENRGLILHGGFKDAVFLIEISRRAARNPDESLRAYAPTAWLKKTRNG